LPSTSCGSDDDSHTAPWIDAPLKCGNACGEKISPLHCQLPADDSFLMQVQQASLTTSNAEQQNNSKRVTSVGFEPTPTKTTFFSRLVQRYRISDTDRSVMTMDHREFSDD
jgi:hypothetical protein